MPSTAWDTVDRLGCYSSGLGTTSEYLSDCGSPSNDLCAWTRRAADSLSRIKGFDLGSRQYALSIGLGSLQLPSLMAVATFMGTAFLSANLAARWLP